MNKYENKILSKLTKKEIKELALWAINEGNFDYLLERKEKAHVKRNDTPEK